MGLRRAACVMVVLACVGLACTPSSQSADPRDGGTTVAVALATSPNGGESAAIEWETLDPGPLEGRGISAVVKAGDEVLFFGPRTMLAVPIDDVDSGVAFNVSTRAWRSIARGGPAHPAAAVATNDAVFVMAHDDDQSMPPRAFVYRPTLDRWDRVASPPIAPTSISPELYWNGSEVIAPQVLAAWDPATGSWRSIHPIPTDLSGSSYQTVAIDGGLLFEAGIGSSFAFLPGDETNPWLQLDIDVPFGSTASYGGGAAGVNERVEFGSSEFHLEANVFDSELRAWRPIAPPPVEGTRCATSAAAVGDGALFDVCTSLVLLDAAENWRVIPRPGRDDRYYGGLVAFGTHVAFYRSASSDQTGELFLADLSSLVGTSDRGLPAPSAPTRVFDVVNDDTVQVGSIRFDVPPGYRVSGTREVSEPRQGFELTFSFPLIEPWPQEPPCTMTSWSTSSKADLFEQWASRSTLPRSPTFARQLNLAIGDVDDLAHVVIELSDKEVLDIACTAPFQHSAITNGLR